MNNKKTRAVRDSGQPSHLTLCSLNNAGALSNHEGHISLKELELPGFIYRKVDAKATPVLVEYELAEYRHSLDPEIQAGERITGI